MPRDRTPADSLRESFLQKARDVAGTTELIRVLRANAYRVGGTNILVRASTLGSSGRYFFGLNYINAEEIANLDNAYFAFICGDINQVVLLPARVLIDHLPLISHDRNGEYKINIDRELNIVLQGRGNRLNCQTYVNNWDALLSPAEATREVTPVEDSVHAVVQGRLLEIGKIRGYATFTPNKSSTFNGQRLGQLASLSTCPELQFSDYQLLRQIDVLWFRERQSRFIPECAFEVELTTGTWSGVLRLATLIDYADVRLYIVSHAATRFEQAMNALPDNRSRYRHVLIDAVGEIYSAELNLRTLRDDIGL